MIFKASERGGGSNLATHLERRDENEHVKILELRGFASSDLHGAFKEVEAISRATKCQKYLFSVSLNPPAEANVSDEGFLAVADRIEQKLGLQGQPRVVVIHEKEGRRHAHLVVSRIDSSTMTARQLSHFKLKLRDLSRELYFENDWKMPRGLMKSGERSPLTFSRAEWEQAKRAGQDPRELQQALRDCWAASDDARSFKRSLEERALFLAKGDRRSFVVVDHQGEVYSLPRTLGLNVGKVRGRLGDSESLPSVQETQKLIAERMTPVVRKHVDESRRQFQKDSAKLAHAKALMSQDHRDKRSTLDARLKDEWETETLLRQARVPRGLRGWWSRLTGKYQEVKRQNEAEAKETRLRHDQERHALVEQQLAERRALQRDIKEQRARQAEQLLELRSELGRYFKLSRAGNANRTSERVQGRQRVRERELEP